MKGHIRRLTANSWQLKFDLPRPKGGKRRTQYVTVRGTKRDAQIKLRELMAASDRGTYVEPTKVTLAEHVRARISLWKISAKTRERYEELAENQIVPHLGDKLLQELKPLDIEEWHARLETSGRRDGKGGVSARTIGHAHRILSRALADACENELVWRNVAAIKKPPKTAGRDMVILTDEQVGELVTALRGRAMFTRAVAALFTGLRRGELLALRWRCVDIDQAKTIQVREALEETKAGGVRFKSPKTKSGIRDVSLPDIVIDALREHRRQQLEHRIATGLGKLVDDALVFPALNGGPQSPRSFSKDWSDAAESIGMGQITFHALRHTHASQLIDSGVDIVTISRRLGHASPNVTLAIYAHLFRKRDDKAAAAINAALAGLEPS